MTKKEKMLSRISTERKILGLFLFVAFLLLAGASLQKVYSKLPKATVTGAEILSMPFAQPHLLLLLVFSLIFIGFVLLLTHTMHSQTIPFPAQLHSSSLEEGNPSFEERKNMSLEQEFLNMQEQLKKIKQQQPRTQKEKIVSHLPARKITHVSALFIHKKKLSVLEKELAQIEKELKKIGQ